MDAIESGDFWLIAMGAREKCREERRSFFFELSPVIPGVP